jgi:RimJ/RimL family protein N-acetyltransferase
MVGAPVSKVLEWLGPEIGDPPPAEMLAEARRDHWLRLSRFWAQADRHVAIRCPDTGAPVGFYTPQITASGVRFGPIYVAPEHRGRGLVAAVYREWCCSMTCVVYAEDGNDRSARAAEAGGLTRWKRGMQGVFFRGGPCAAP